MSRIVLILGAAMLLAMVTMPPVDAYIYYNNYSSLCGANLTLKDAFQSIQINFNVPKSIADNVPNNCRCTITLDGKDDSLLLYSAITKLEGFDDNTWNTTLKMINHNFKSVELIMKDPMACYLTITPIKLIHPNKDNVATCPPSFVQRAETVCLHKWLACDGVMQTPGDEFGCPQYISPDPRTLLIYIASVPAVFLSLSALLALYLYFFLFNEDKNGLAKQGKQMFYGTVNGSFNSQSSLCTTSSGSSDELPKESAGQLYRDNLQQHFEKESLISKSPKK